MLMARRVFLLGALVMAAAAVASDGPVSAGLVDRLLRRDPVLHVIDVRTPEEFASAHIAGAINLPHDLLETQASSLPADHAAPIVVYCRSGRRSALAVETLRKLGYTQVLHLEGDFIGWQAAGHPVMAAPASAPKP